MNVEDLDAGDKAKKFSDYYEFQQELGHGSFGIVVAARYRRTMEECAVKVPDTSCSSLLD